MPLRPPSRIAPPICWLAACLVAAEPGQAAEPAPAFLGPIQSILEEYLRDGGIPGGAVGVLAQGEFFPFTAGVRDLATGAPVTEETLFPIGSITKIFTGIMLADLALAGTVNLEDRVVDYLPPEVGRDGGAIRQITLLDLATHTSGMTEAAPGNPAEQVYFDLPPLPNVVSRWKTWSPTPPDPGDPYLYSYSNFGFLTLGFAVAEAGQRGGYNPLFRELFRDPLDLRYLQTRGTLTPALLGLVTQGYGVGQDPNESDGNGVNANLRDAASFLRACIQSPDAPDRLRRAVEFSQRPYRSKFKNDTNDWIGLGWDLNLTAPYQASKNGATAGVFSDLKLRPHDGLAVLVMVNGKPAEGNRTGRLANDIVDAVLAHGEPELALGRPTRQSNGSGKNRPNDGDASGATFWAAEGPEDWWEVDLEAVHAVGFLHVLALWNETHPQPYEAWTSLDRVEWELAVDQAHRAEPTSRAGDGFRIAPRLARWVRLQSRTSPLRLVEVRIFAAHARAAAAQRFARPTLTVTPDPAMSVAAIRYSYRRPLPASGFDFAVNLSSDLAHWASLDSARGAPEIVPDPGGASETVTWRWTVPRTPEDAAAFVRLSVIAP